MTQPAYISHLQNAIMKTFDLASAHIETVEVVETLRGKAIWAGEVEVFNVSGHPDAQCCYAWANDTNMGSHSIVVLGRPPIKSARDAIRAAIITNGKRSSNN